MKWSLLKLNNELIESYNSKNDLQSDRITAMIFSLIPKCPRCAGTGNHNCKLCSLCDGTGMLEYALKSGDDIHV